MNVIPCTAETRIPELDLYTGNRETHLLRYFEPEPGIFIAESKNVIEIALRHGYSPLHAVCLEDMTGHPLVQQLGDIPVFVLDEAEAKRRFGYVLTGGISCAMRRKKTGDYRAVMRNASRVVVLEDVENPTNVGAIFRSAAAFGIDAVLLSPGCADPLYRRALRVSVGNALQIPWAYIGTSETEWKEIGVDLLRQEGFVTAAMALREDNLDIDDARLRQASRLALLMGNEGMGLSERTVQACDYVVKIPMQNGVDSLNVAVAAGIAMWEIRK